MEAELLVAMVVQERRAATQALAAMEEVGAWVESGEREPRELPSAMALMLLMTWDSIFPSTAGRSALPRVLPVARVAMAALVVSVAPAETAEMEDTHILEAREEVATEAMARQRLKQTL